jgi:hypothetical protein
MDKHLDHIQNKNQFVQSVKNEMDRVAFEKIADMKKEIANQILKSEE